MEYKVGMVEKNCEVSPGIFNLHIKGEFKGKSGQFYMIKAEDGYNMLPRPISIHRIDSEGISFLYKVKGKGTEKLSTILPKNGIKLFGPLGNGFNIDEIEKKHSKVALVSGGIGIAPMHQLIKELKNVDLDLYCGFESVDYSVENVEKNVNSKKISTVSGKKGSKGFITDELYVENYDLIITCGPQVMMKKIAEDCKEKGVDSLILMENYMACGVGACLGCTCETVWGRKKVCTEGPVFRGEELVL